MTDRKPDSMAGKVLGDYRVERRLGGGGFGALYAGAHVRTGRKYALKILRPDRALVSPDARERFRREAEALSGLGHIGIVAIHDYASADGIDYIVMDLLEGEDLAERLSRGPFALEEGIELLSAIGDALQTAHDANIIHRDLKPGNVFLAQFPGEPQRPVLLDFGLAKDVSGNAQSMTASGEALGTPTYMAPEQASGGPIDERTDVYALGALAYEVLSGEPPFDGANATAIILQLMTTEPRPLQERVSVPNHVAAAIHRALNKDADERHSSIRAFIQELGGKQPATRAMPVASVSPPTAVEEAPTLVESKGGRAPLWVALGTAIAVVVGVGGWMLTRPAEPMAMNAVPVESVEALVPAEVTETETETDTQTETETETDTQTETETETDTQTETDTEAETETETQSVMRRRTSMTSMVGAPPPDPQVEAPPTPMVVERATAPSDAQQEGSNNAELRALEGLLSHLERMRSGLSTASQGRRPAFCGRAVPRRSNASSTVVSIGQRLDRIRTDICEPFASAREPSAEVRDLFRQLQSTLDRSQRMAEDTGSQNQPVSVANEVKDAIARARRAIEGFGQGTRAFPCDDSVWADLRRLSTSANSWSGTAARNVASKASRICSRMGLGRANIGRVAERSGNTLDDIEGDLRSAIRPLQPL